MIKTPAIVSSQQALAAVGRTEVALSTPASMPVVRIGGPISATFRRLQAEREAKTYRALAESTRAQTEFVATRADLARSFLTTAQAIAELRELPVILEHDAQMRQAQRDSALARVQREAAESRYGLDATQDEINELRSKQRAKTAERDQSALRALTKAKIELEALGCDTAEIDQAMERIETK